MASVGGTTDEYCRMRTMIGIYNGVNALFKHIPATDAVFTVSLHVRSLHVEQPERVSTIWDALEKTGCVGRCAKVEV